MTGRPTGPTSASGSAPHLHRDRPHICTRIPLFVLNAATASPDVSSSSRGVKHGAPALHGIPHRWYPTWHVHPTRHGIPHGMVSRTAWYPTPHGIPHSMVSVSAAASADTSARSRTSNSVTSKPDKGKDEPAPQRALPCVRACVRARARSHANCHACLRAYLSWRAVSALQSTVRLWGLWCLCTSRVSGTDR